MSTLQSLAVQAGYRSLLTDGLAKAGDGLTTAEEVLRVVGFDQGA